MAASSQFTERGRPEKDGQGSILVLSPSSDLYGSDRALLAGLPAMLERRRVVLIVPEAGPLVAAAEEVGADVVVHRDFALRRRYLTPTALPGWAFDVARVALSLKSRFKGRVDLVYVNTVAVPLVPLLGRLVDAPVLLHVHERARGSKWQQKVIADAADRFSNLILTNSFFTARTIDATRTPIEVVYNGVEVPEVPMNLDGYTGEQRALKIVCVGRLHPKKGQWVLLEAARLAHRHHGANWEIHFYGDALPEHAWLETKIKELAADLPGRVKMHGYVSATDEMYQNMDVSVVPSVDPEEFSLVCAESQARGLPVVTTGPGGASEVVVDGETGYVVPPDDAHALAARLIEFEEAPELRRQMGLAGHARMAERFSVARYGEQIGEHIDRLLEQ